MNVFSLKLRDLHLGEYVEHIHWQMMTYPAAYPNWHLCQSCRKFSKAVAISYV
jgi:hypothetical protein